MPGYLSPGLGVSTVTEFQSAPSSSARIIASAVRTPCPISARLATSATAPCPSIVIHLLGANSCLAVNAAFAAARGSSGRRIGTRRTSAAPPSAEARRKSRRVAR